MNRSHPWGFRNAARAAALLAALAAVLLLAASPAVSASSLRRSLGDGMVATLDPENDLWVEATPRRGEGLWAFTRRLTGDTEALDEISRLNRRPRRLIAGVRYKTPFDVLRPELQVRVVQKLFPIDQLVAEGWRFQVPEGRSLTTWRVAEWLTGHGGSFEAIGLANSLRGEYTLRPGQVVVIPAALLRPAFRQLLPATTTLAEVPQPAPPEAGDPPAAVPGFSSDGELRYVSDESGKYAVYRLKSGEALYSSVVVRYTGAVRGPEVNTIAADLAKLNGIADVKDMPIGQPVRIPFDLLLPEYLPAADPRRQLYETNRAASAKYSNTVRASRLEDITVILDAGHGGQDPGANKQGTWESIYVYDVMLRVKKLLETTTSARVEPTTRDGRDFQLIDRDVLPTSRRHVVLTKPEYPIRDVKVSANLRWYLANSRHRQAVKRSGDDSKTIFISIHADSLHRSLRGAMVYIPATSLTKGSYGKTAKVYTSRREVKEQPRINFSWKERTRSEGLSRQFAEQLLRQFRRQGLAVHREKPIRDRIILCRRCRAYVPAVVRRNAVPTKVLIEICNLNNPQDRQLVRTRAYRQKVAVAIVDSILAYYGQPALPSPPPRIASGGEGAAAAASARDR